MNLLTFSKNPILLVSLLLCLAATSQAFCPLSSSRLTTRHSTSSNTRLGVWGDDAFDMNELQQRIHSQQTTVPPLLNKVMTRRPQHVHAVFFHPHSDQEGMHTIEYPQGSGNNVILAFEDEHDCRAFSQDLSKQQFDNPTPCEMTLTSLEQTCASLGVYCQVVPKGTKIKPPSKNVKHFGHDPQLQQEKRNLTFLFEMSDREVEHDAGAIVNSSFTTIANEQEDDLSQCWE